MEKLCGNFVLKAHQVCLMFVVVFCNVVLYVTNCVMRKWKHDSLWQVH